MKLAPDGSLLWSTYLGGTQGDSAMNGVAADAHGDVYVTGWTDAHDYQRTSGLPADFVGHGIGSISGAFFAKISSAGNMLIYAGLVAANQHSCSGGSSCFLSPISTSGASVAVDSSGDAYIGGNTSGYGIQGTPGALLTSGIGPFILKVNANGAGLGYLTFLGAGVNGGFSPFVSPASGVTAISADQAGNVYLVATTSDPKLPTTPGVVQPGLAIPSQRVNPFVAPPTDAYVAKLNSSGSAMVWATFLGGSAADQATAIAVDSAGKVWVSGTTQSSDFPITTGAPQGQEFLAELNATGSALLTSLRFSQNIVGQAVAVDPSGTIITAGGTGLVSAISSGPSGPRIFGVANAAGGALAGRVAPGELISLFGVQLGPPTPVTASFNSAGFLPTSLGGVQVTVNGMPAPLLYVSSSQINAVTPFEVTIGTSGTLQITVNGAPLSGFRIFTDAAAPEIFRNSDGSAAAINQDGTVNSAANPAKAGSILSIWVTGVPQAGGIDGQMQTSARPTFCACWLQTFTPPPNAVSIDYAGAAPGTVAGVTQINFEAPNQPSPLYLFLGVTSPPSNTPGVAGQTSNIARIFVSP
jgi:uncharacterized protein (TIGR03437 family)